MAWRARLLQAAVQRNEYFVLCLPAHVLLSHVMALKYVDELRTHFVIADSCAWGVPWRQRWVSCTNWPAL
eukprot:15476811-Alexandrium_andersonii.AAC.1